MALPVFPLTLFPPSQWKWDIAGAPIVGGQPVSGPPQTADASGGGWWTCDWTVGLLSTPDEHRYWRALMMSLRNGVGKIVVPVLDACQPWPDSVSRLATDTPFSDGASYSDGSLFAGDAISATLAAAAYAPAWPAPAAPPTQVKIDVSIGGALHGGEYYSLIGTSGLPRLHMITGVSDVTGSVYTCSVYPPHRENYDAGSHVEFDRPLCTMKLDVSQLGNVLQDLRPGFSASPSVRFVETML